MKKVIIGWNFACKQNFELGRFFKKYFSNNEKVTFTNVSRLPFVNYYQNNVLVKNEGISSKEEAYKNILKWIASDIIIPNSKIIENEKEEILRVTEWYNKQDKKLKCFIINWNRLGLLENLAKWCSEHNLEVIIIDNNSSYEPLLDWYKNCPYIVEKMPENYGFKVVWEQGLVDKYISKNDRYIVTDSDLDLSTVPDDFLTILHYGLNKYTFSTKCGLYLKNSDLPDNKYTKEIKRLSYLPKNFILSNFFAKCVIDTTFALYRESCRIYTIKNTIAVYQTDYQIKHIPWYYDNYDNLPDDEKYYLSCKDNNNPNPFMKNLYNMIKNDST